MESTTLLDRARDVLTPLGLTLDEEQLHIGGERFLMMKNKMVLTGHDKNDKKIIIKIATHPDGQREITHEKQTRDLLKSIVFANDKILFPEEAHFGMHNGIMVWVTEFIPQEKVYVAHTLEEQFFLILRAFEEQESFHATTFEHLKSIDKFFPIFHAREYFEELNKFEKTIQTLGDNELDGTINDVKKFLLSNKQTIDKHSNYLTHTDFVPHNFRVKGKTIYMLDLSAVQFGNKYEGWARFLNYMVIHNPKLENLLSEYIQKNRGAEEYLNLRLMRAYKLVFLLDFYTRSLTKTEGDLKNLTLERIDFWHEVLKSILEDKSLPDNFVEEYKKKRDNLRSEEEKKRQREFAVA